MDDMISRKAAIDAILAINNHGNSDRANALGLAELAITTLPPAQPERKRGRWLPDNNNCITPKFVCSACGMPQNVETVMYYPLWAFCPRCGAKMMRGEQDGEELGRRDSR